MIILKPSAIALMITALPLSVQAQTVPAGTPKAPMAVGAKVVPPMVVARQAAPWVHGTRAPGGWAAYRRPSLGAALPSYWINPDFYLGNYSTYGFSRPAAGFGWSRYYNDAVLTDRNGRVQDYVEGVEWDRYGDAGDYNDSYGYSDDGYDDRQQGRANERASDRDGGLGGALVGGAVGAVTGSVVAGRGDRTAGALIGGVVGAVAGAAVDSGDRAGRGYKSKRSNSRRGRDMDYDYGYGHRDGVTYNGEWQRDEWQGPYEGAGPHWNRGGHDRRTVIRHRAPYGHGYGYGYGYGAPEIITVTVQSQPVITTTTTTTEEVVYAAAARKRYAPRRAVHKPRPKPRCVCR